MLTIPPPRPPHQLYCTPDLDLLSSACRFTLPGRSVAFGGRNGATLAAAGDDGMIKLVAVGDDSKVFRQIATNGYVRSVSLDPEGAYVAAALADGTVGVWDVATGAQEARKSVGNKVAADSTRRNAVQFSPDGGTFLAATGYGNDVVLLERLSWWVGGSVDESMR
jgi:WD40 repeat protein